MSDRPETSECLDENAVADLISGALDELASERLAAHLDECVRCRQTVALLVREERPARTSLAARRSRARSQERGAPWHRFAAPGEQIGRYVVTRMVGAGGMGIVYAAHDPELDRDIALKLIRPEFTESDEVIRERLRRESQALAKLSHPNVTAVYDIGTDGGEVFVAIELIDGVTLADWLAQSKRSWRAILRVFRQAGQGIAAAHAANLVHRDFKPDNVLIATDGRVAVTDFGLARLVDEVWRDPLDVSDEELDTQEMDLTTTGIAVGTPAYMAPEQHRGRPTDHRTDQFSFCVALYEALYGWRPFAGTTPSQVAKAAERGQIRDRPARSPVPMWLHRIILKGLRVNPSDRFESMDELLASIRRRQMRGRKRIFATTAVGAAVAGLVLGVTVGRGGASRPSGCEPGIGKITAAWGPKRRAAISGAFLRSGLAHATDTYSVVEYELDRITRAWVEAHDRTCADGVSGGTSADVFDLKMLCLNRRLRELDSLSSLLAEGDPAVVDRAVELTRGLTPLSECDSVNRIVGALRPPEDQRTRLRVNLIRDQLAEARTLSLAARYARASQLIEEALVEARETGYRPIEAEALVLKGSVLDLAGDHVHAEEVLREAGLAAESSRHDSAAAAAWTQLVFVVGHQRAQHQRGLEYASQAQAAIERMGGDDLRLAELRTHSGSIYLDMADYDRAQSAFEDAIEAVRRAHGGDHANMSMALDGLANIYRDRGEFARALELSQRSLGLREEHLGRDHPSLAGPLDTQAGLLFVQGKPVEALPLLDRALTLQRRSLGEEHSEIALTLVLMGLVKSDLGDDAAAVNLLSTALAMQERLLGHDHPELARTLVNYGAVLSAAGRHQEAESHYRRAVAMARSTFAADHPDIGTYLYYLGDSVREQGRAVEALELYRESLANLEKVFSSDHPDLAGLRWSMGEAYVAAGEPRRALIELDRSLAIADRARMDPIARARIQWSNARLSWELRRDLEGALALASEALATFEAEVGPEDEELIEMRRWLSARLGD